MMPSYLGNMASVVRSADSNENSWVQCQIFNSDSDEKVSVTTDNMNFSENNTDIDDSSWRVIASIGKEKVNKSESLSDDIIDLNVGGQRITTFRSTLTAVPNSKLALQFTKDNKNITKSKSKQDMIYFFDYNAVQFDYLLDQLRAIKRMPQTPAYDLNIIAPNVDVRFNFSDMLFELGLNPDRFLSPLVDTHVNLTVKSLIGWKECYRGKYNAPFDVSILTNTCKSKRLLVACRSTADKNTLTVAGVGKREDIFRTCTPNSHCVTEMKNGTGFYYVQDHAWGFEGGPQGAVAMISGVQRLYYGGVPQRSFYLNPCDSSDENSDYRLCWSLRSTVGRGGGDRCGRSKNLHNTKEWERLIYQAV